MDICPFENEYRGHYAQHMGSVTADIGHAGRWFAYIHAKKTSSKPQQEPCTCINLDSVNDHNLN